MTLSYRKKITATSATNEFIFTEIFLYSIPRVNTTKSSKNKTRTTNFPKKKSEFNGRHFRYGRSSEALITIECWRLSCRHATKDFISKSARLSSVIQEAWSNQVIFS